MIPKLSGPRRWTWVHVMVLGVLASTLFAACKTGELGLTNFSDTQIDGKLAVRGNTNNYQLAVRANATQSTAVFVVQNASGTPVASFDKTGALTVSSVVGSTLNDLNGGALTWDPTGNTKSQATADNSLILTLGGTPTAASYLIQDSQSTPIARFRGGAGISELQGGSLKVGNGTPGNTLNGEDLYVEGDVEVDGSVQFDGSFTAGVSEIDSTEIANVERRINLPLFSWIECDTDAGTQIGFGESVDALPDFINSSTDGTGFTLRFDATSGSEDQNTSICSQFMVPADYASGGSFRVRYAKPSSAGATEVINCSVSVNGAALQAAGTATTASTNASAACSPTISSLAANDSVSANFYITSGTTMDEYVEFLAVSFLYTATQ